MTPRAILALAVVGLLAASCAQGDPGGYPQSPADSGTATQVDAQPDGPGPREGTYSGAYVLVSGSGKMLLIVSADGTVTLIPKDVNAFGTGTIDPSGNIDVTTGYDTYAQSTLTFTGTVSLVGETWKASGAVAGITSDSSGTWTATQ